MFPHFLESLELVIIYYRQTLLSGWLHCCLSLQCWTPEQRIGIMHSGTLLISMAGKQLCTQLPCCYCRSCWENQSRNHLIKQSIINYSIKHYSLVSTPISQSSGPNTSAIRDLQYWSIRKHTLCQFDRRFYDVSSRSAGIWDSKAGSQYTSRFVPGKYNR